MLALIMIMLDYIVENNLGNICRCFPPGGSHQRVNLYACSLSQMVMQEGTKIYPVRAREGPTSSGGGKFVLSCTEVLVQGRIQAWYEVWSSATYERSLVS